MTDNEGGECFLTLSIGSLAQGEGAIQLDGTSRAHETESLAPDVMPLWQAGAQIHFGLSIPILSPLLRTVCQMELLIRSTATIPH